ncbi:hypothetical protein MKW94_012141 [Papaver nudicaule]|uniref:Uncharacterized protein n=1 Tax=Papaver nudicaule TaxID=74823 RepID=A0AA41V3M9_PAPNU|nr:hypothetical protein [Papaver nudicaule]
MVAIRILVVGYQGAGKTAMLQSLNCRITDDLTEYAVDFDTNEDLQLSFLCSESCDSRITDPKYAGYIVMFDVTKVVSYKYAREILQPKGYTPDGVRQYEISARTNENKNIVKPFQSLARYILQ